MSPVKSKTESRNWNRTLGSDKVIFHLMDAADESNLQDAIKSFTSNLPSSDLVFLRMDITQPEAVEEWMNNVRKGRTITVLAELDGEIVGYGNLHLSTLQWTRHIGEIRILVASKHRRLGVGKVLAQDMIDIAAEKGLSRVVAHIAATQPRVRTMFESLGFEPEALLTDWLKDHSGKVHDLIIMSRSIEE
ncbi:MAG: hypothetical protein COA73_02435 [Candidatus Hydrogenedentota bacterium]|nr:MAG: hypothetical protein COA73_02435 [Candidatus Hydrogenedentota bacterium]